MNTHKNNIPFPLVSGSAWKEIREIESTDLKGKRPEEMTEEERVEAITAIFEKAEKRRAFAERNDSQTLIGNLPRNEWENKAEAGDTTGDTAKVVVYIPDNGRSASN